MPRDDSRPQRRTPVGIATHDISIKVQPDAYAALNAFAHPRGGNMSRAIVDAVELLLLRRLPGRLADPLLAELKASKKTPHAWHLEMLVEHALSLPDTNKPPPKLEEPEDRVLLRPIFPLKTWGEIERLAKAHWGGNNSQLVMELTNLVTRFTGVPERLASRLREHAAQKGMDHYQLIEDLLVQRALPLVKRD